MKIVVSLLVFIFYLQNTILAQPTNLAINTANKLKAYLSTFICEKAYLQFNKPYYIAGDTIYFKSYVTEGEKHQLSDLSKVLYVELINQGNLIIQSIKLQLDSGISWGDFVLEDSLPAGTYRIRAYTRWMLNNNMNGLFEKPISIGALREKRIMKNNIFQHTNIVNKIDIQFFPEGGELVEDIRQKIAFKVINESGLGISVKGILLNNDNDTICSFQTEHNGMGYFYLLPLNGKTYKAIIIAEDGSRTMVYLPKPTISGIVLHIDNDSASRAFVTITSNKSYYKLNRDRNFFLIIYSGGKVVALTINLDSTIINFAIVKQKFQTGIAVITLFSPEGEPLCERLLFIKKNDQLALNIETDKAQYSKRDKVIVRLKTLFQGDTTVSGHFSISVIDENKIPVNENKETNILTNLLLTADLKGYIEKPNYYFVDTSMKSCKDLDVLMLTQGYRHFDWKHVLDTIYILPPYQPEMGLSIDGKVTHHSGKPVSGKIIMLMPLGKGTLLTCFSDSTGRFNFSDLLFSDTAHFVLSVLNEKGQNSDYDIVYTPTKILTPVTTCKDYNLNNQLELEHHLLVIKKERDEFPGAEKAKVDILKEVEVRGFKKDNQYRTESLVGAGNADQVMHAQEIEKISGLLSTSLNGRLHGVDFINGIPYLKGMQAFNVNPMLVIVDGVEQNSVGQNGKMLPYNIDEIPLSNVETVEILKYANASIYGMEGGGGVLVITTKRYENFQDKTKATGIFQITSIGFYKARIFYTPKYDHEDGNTKPDLRSAIYWAPEIKTDKSGNASFNFYNADGAGTYRIEVEGIADDGRIGHSVYKYTVR